MGGMLYVNEVKTKSEKKLVKEFNKAILEAKAYYGENPYSGSLATLTGIRVVSDPLPNRKWTAKKKKEVTDILAERVEKWYDALAVKTSKGFLIVAILAS